MNNQKASSSNSNKEADGTHMPAWLFRAAVKGDKQVLDSEKEVTIVVSESDPNQKAEKLSIENLKSATYMNNTVLHILATYGHTELVYTICQRDGSMWKTQNKMRETPFHCAAKAGHAETISKLIEFASSDKDELMSVLREKNKHGEMALHEAARHGHSNVVFKLMEVDPLLACEFNDDGISPLYLAAAIAPRKGKILVVNEMLIQLSMHNIKPVYSDGRIINTVSAPPPPPPPSESVGTNPRVIQMPPSVVKRANIKKTKPIDFLALTGKADAVKLLLENDSSLAYLPNHNGFYPVHLAAHAGNVKMLALLMIKFPDSSELLDFHGRNFFHIAAEENKVDVFAQLMVMNSMKSYFTELWDEPRKNPLNNMREMFIRMLEETDNEGNTPFHLAAEKGYKSVMKTIWKIKRGLDVRNRNGLTPFEISVIQMEGNTKDSEVIQECIREYKKYFGDCFSYCWFDDVMKISEQYQNKMMEKLQLIGLGAVLIATVAFAVAFTPPGGYDSNGFPVLGRKYIFKAFILADILAFVLSALSVTIVIYDGLAPSHILFSKIDMPWFFLSLGLRCMILAFGLGLYLMLSPVCKGVSIIVLILILLTLVRETIAILRPICSFFSTGPRGGRVPLRIESNVISQAGGDSYLTFFLCLLAIFLFSLLK